MIGQDGVMPGRRSIDTGRGSMERQSDDSESDQEQSDSKSSTSCGKPKKKSLAQDMKEKFSFLRRRPTDTSLPSKDGKLPKPTKEMVINWSTSFDALLKDKVGMELFKDFLRTEFSEENVEFWIACEEYKNVKSNKLNARAEEIFSDYVAVQAPREINLDSKTRMATRDLMEKPDRQTFELAQKRIQALMDKDSYPRFLRSDVYQKLLSEYKIQLTLT
ncbi:hypothetical protein LSH36_22g01019 [Paralvinella palmiformis]|uniref:RGS domain-containing protein n=1 Tax=Paralvinella palmiformis TaxID=53620 RepID=A0AAD9KA47_9ANNE|nr:hypothetical protein LSH36_22g01019 [Paralvinella palmiformis]